MCTPAKDRVKADKTNKRIRDWRWKNHEKFSQYARDNMERRRKHPVFHHYDTLRLLMNALVRRMREGKTIEEAAATADAYRKRSGHNPISFLKAVEKSFKDGMTWQNYGKVWKLEGKPGRIKGATKAEISARYSPRNCKGCYTIAVANAKKLLGEI